jgi:hypothetical protein
MGWRVALDATAPGHMVRFVRSFRDESKAPMFANRNLARLMLTKPSAQSSQNIRIMDSGTENANRLMPAPRDEETRPLIVRARPD